MWEDQKNYEGGRWLITIDKRLRSSCLDSFWLEIMMCLIGEAFGEFGNAGTIINDIFVYILVAFFTYCSQFSLRSQSEHEFKLFPGKKQGL